MTSAETALRYARGELELNQKFVSESIIGSLFYSKAVEETWVGPFPALAPAIRGSAYITGCSNLCSIPATRGPEGST